MDKAASLHAHRSAALTHRFVSRFEDADNAQTLFAAAQRNLAADNALAKVLHHSPQGLGGIQLRGPHVAGAIADQNVVQLVAVGRDDDAAVEDLDLFTGL